jgi:uncharacterized glyoxalase superfamily protein PhnB
MTTTLSSLDAIFTVNNLQASITWYRDILGFTVADEWKGDDGTLIGASLSAGDVKVNLGQDDFAKGRDRKKGVGFRIYCMTDQDVDALATEIKARSGTLATEPTTQPWGTRDFSMVDPDGFKISIGKATQES